MNHETLIQRVAEATEEPLGIVEFIINTALREITDAVADGEAVLLEGFGQWEAKPIPASVGKPAYLQIQFRPAHKWRKRLRHEEAA